jgi:serine protease Do
VIPSAHGIGFAISVNGAKPILKELIATGKVAPRPSIGVVAVSVTPQIAYVNDLPVERGALVIRVEPGGPAEAVGFRPGDVITAVAGEVVKDLHHFHESLFRRKPGDVVDVTLWREGQTVTFRPVLGEDR